MSRRQLHEAIRGAGEGRKRHRPAMIREAAVEREREDAREAVATAAVGTPGCAQDRAARSCGMEALVS